MLLRERISGFHGKVYRTAAGLWAYSAVVPRHQNILGVLRQGDDPQAHLILGSNIVTNAGDIYYATRMANGSPTNTFNTHELASAGTPGKANNRSDVTAIGSTQKTNSATYPKVNDGDSDNTGAGVDICTHLAEYTKGDFNATSITHGIITNPTPGASEACLTIYAFSAGFAKTADDTLKVFVNHEALGV